MRHIQAEYTPISLSNCNPSRCVQPTQQVSNHTLAEATVFWNIGKMMCIGNTTCLGPKVVEQHGGQVALPKAGQDDYNELALVLNALSKPADMQVSRYAQTAAASMTGLCIAATLMGHCACWVATLLVPSSPSPSSK